MRTPEQPELRLRLHGPLTYSGPMLEVEQWPALREPVMLVALTGWVDGGLAGTGALAVVVESLGSPRKFGSIDLADLLDLQQTRPSVKLVDGVTREIEWPSIDLVAGNAGVDVIIVAGPEPSVRWRDVTSEIVNVARQLDVKLAVTLGGMPAPVSHRRPVPVLATAASRSVAQEVGALRGDYVGPTGAQTVLQVALGDSGIRSVGFWAQVPHYVAATPSPPAIRALLERLREVAGLSVDLRALDEQSDAYLERVEEGLSERPDVADMVRQLETANAQDETVSGEDLAREIERFLRDER
jgi:predicted ATP-grasp superfamily ATP-dependent carboligase